jgi:hypothetical protein
MSFDFTAAIRPLMEDIVATCEDLSHVDMARVGVAFAQARNRRLDGVYATIHPLRFAGGGRTVQRRGHVLEMPQVVVNGQDLLYIITYCLPRFLDLPFEKKLSTVVHELFHISPRFDGDVRRLGGGKPYHAGSKRQFDAAMSRMAEAYLRATRRPELHGFLRQTFREIAEAHGRIVGFRFRAIRPKRIG